MNGKKLHSMHISLFQQLKINKSNMKPYWILYTVSTWVSIPVTSPFTPRNATELRATGWN